MASTCNNKGLPNNELAQLAHPVTSSQDTCPATQWLVPIKLDDELRIRSACVWSTGRVYIYICNTCIPVLLAFIS